MRRPSRKTILGCGAAIAAMALATTASAQQRTFDIPAQDANKAIPQFAQQAGIQIIAPSSELRGVRTPAVRGTIDARKALAQLLAGTGLAVTVDTGTSVSLKRVGHARPQDAAAAGNAESDGSRAAATSFDESASVVEEVIVRATKRDESIMQVPVSMTAVTAADIDRIGAKNLEDLAKSVPGVVIRNSSEQIDKTYVIRGISSNARSSTVAVYIDDTPITFGTYTPDLKLIDVAQIEFLRGPQGTLFGSSSMGGAIRYTSQEPSFGAMTGMVKAEGGLVHDGGVDYEFQGAVGGPLVADRLAFRASAFARRDGGYIDLVDEDTGKVRKDDVNTVDTYGARAMLKARLGEDFDATLSAIYQQQDADYSGVYFSARGMDVAVPISLSRQADVVDLLHPARLRCGCGLQLLRSARAGPAQLAGPRLRGRQP
jgi:iron complex outermembrane receptor protein